jgi:hypothetical protein
LVIVIYGSCAKSMVNGLSYWYEMDPLEFFNVMEVPRNIHLAWKYYRWDLLNNCLNTRKYETVKKSLIDFE